MYTGDMCRRDADGWLFFGHRKEEGGLRMLGEIISEGFIRRVVLEHPDVSDVHIYGVPSRRGAPGETDIVAACVVRDRAGFDVRGLFAHCTRNLERSHVPDYVQVMNALPKTPSEKVQTRFLIEAFQSGQDVHGQDAAAVAERSPRG